MSFAICIDHGFLMINSFYFELLDLPVASLFGGVKMFQSTYLQWVLKIKIHFNKMWNTFNLILKFINLFSLNIVPSS